MAAPKNLDFYLDADDAYKPLDLPTGIVKMGGKEYTVRCPKDSLPMLLSRIESQAQQEGQDLAIQEELISKLVAACFEPDDTAEIVERVISPYDRTLSIAFLVDTVQRVYKQYAPYLDAAYDELGLENPVKQPQDRKTSKKPGARKAVAAKKTAAPAKRTRAPRRTADV